MSLNDGTTKIFLNMESKNGFQELCQLEGEKRGRNKTLIIPITKKHAKNKSLEVIAEELEQTVDEIRPIYDIVIQHPDKTVDEFIRTSG